MPKFFDSEYLCKRVELPDGSGLDERRSADPRGFVERKGWD